MTKVQVIVEHEGKIYRGDYNIYRTTDAVDRAFYGEVVYAAGKLVLGAIDDLKRDLEVTCQV
jgi:hypothetical protein